MSDKPKAGLTKRISSRVSRIKKHVSSAFSRSRSPSPSRRHSSLPEHDTGRLDKPAENPHSPTSTFRARIVSGVAAQTPQRFTHRSEDSADQDYSSAHLEPTFAPGLQPLHSKASVQSHTPQEIVSSLPGAGITLATDMHTTESTTVKACSAGLTMFLWWAIHLSITASSRTTVRAIHVVIPILTAIFVSHERVSAANVAWSRI